jgi:hypothetical protein
MGAGHQLSLNPADGATYRNRISGIRNKQIVASQPERRDLRPG